MGGAITEAIVAQNDNINGLILLAPSPLKTDLGLDKRLLLDV